VIWRHVISYKIIRKHPHHKCVFTWQKPAELEWQQKIMNSISNFIFTTCVNHGFTLSRSKRLISPPKCLAHQITSSLGNRGPLLSGEHSGYGADCTSPPSLNINNVWRYIFAFPYAFMDSDIFSISHLLVLLLGYHEKFL